MQKVIANMSSYYPCMQHLLAFDMLPSISRLVGSSHGQVQVAKLCEQAMHLFKMQAGQAQQAQQAHAMEQSIAPNHFDPMLSIYADIAQCIQLHT